MMSSIEDLLNPNCTKCKLHKYTEYVCDPGWGNFDPHIMVVSKMSNSVTYQRSLEADLAEAGLEPQDMYWTAALKCKTFDANASNLDVKMCREYLDIEIEHFKPKWILSLGNEALFSTTGHSGITKYRGRVITKGDYSVFPTISPASVMRNPGQRQAYMADLQLFAAHVYEKSSTVPQPTIWVVNTKRKVEQLKGMLEVADLVSYDIETTRDDERVGKIVCLCGTIPKAMKDRSGEPRNITFALPLFHPQSPFKAVWRSLLRHISTSFQRVPKQVAHNGKFDSKWLRQYGVEARVSFDTMIAAHILDENRQKGLKPQASSRLGVAPWAIETKDLLNTSLNQVLRYCSLDTWYTYHIYLDIRAELIEQPRLARIFSKILMPAGEIFTEAEMRGIWIDRERLATNTKIAGDMIEDITHNLMQWVPTSKDTMWPTYKNGKEVGINFAPSIFSRWLLFKHLGLPILARGKEKPDGSPGDPSMAEGVMLELKGHHPVIEVMLKRQGWLKNSQFLQAYEELADDNDRVHTTFKLYGTVTGRLSSGKAEADKVSGRAPIRGINLQQVPRDVFIRGLFGAAPGFTFVEVDFSQVELRVVAFLSRDRTMLHLYQTGQDIHRATAAWVLGIPASRIDKVQRKKAKAVNFGFAYGMGAKKFVQTAFEKYELHFTLDEAQGIRRQFFERFSGLLPWHARQRRLVHEYARVQSPIGRVRHLPDIRSQDPNVVAEAERQAINSPVQSFASDMNLLGMITTKKAFEEEGLEAHIVGNVHDATLFEIKTEQVPRALSIIKYKFEHLPLKKMFGVEMDVPIVADLKTGGWWGDAVEVDPKEIEDY